MFFEKAIEAGATPEQFWEWDEYETLVFIKGYHARLDDARQSMSIFWAQYHSTRKKTVKPSDIYMDRHEREKKTKAQARAENLGERNELLRDWKKTGPPQLPKRPHRTE